MNYYYSQRYYVYAQSIIGWSWGRKLTMASHGCLITATAMLLSYFNDRPLYPDQWLTWLLRHNGLTNGGSLIWAKVTEGAGGKLRYSTTPNARPGETTYGLREVKWGSQKHWVLDHPLLPGKVIDPWDGSVKPYLHEHPYTGRVIYFIGTR